MSSILKSISLSPQRHDIQKFAYCSLSRVLHVTNRQHASIWIWVSSEALPYEFGRQLVPNLLLSFLLLHRADETQPGRNSCPRLQFLAFSLDSTLCRCRIKLSTQSDSFLLHYVSIFGPSDLLQIPAAFSSASSYTIDTSKPVARNMFKVPITAQNVGEIVRHICKKLAENLLDLSQVS